MSILGSLLEPATKLLDKVIEDKDQKNALSHEIATMAERHAQELAQGQLEVNKVEAAHKSLFVAGWRPAIGWVCALGLFYNVILANIIGIWIDLPEIDTTLLVPVMMGMCDRSFLQRNTRKHNRHLGRFARNRYNFISAGDDGNVRFGRYEVL